MCFDLRTYTFCVLFCQVQTIMCQRTYLGLYNVHIVAFSFILVTLLKSRYRTKLLDWAGIKIDEEKTKRCPQRNNTIADLCTFTILFVSGKLGYILKRQIMKTRNCPYCYGEDTIFGIRRPKCDFCDGKKVTCEFVEWENSKVKFRDKMVDSLEAVMELKLTTVMDKWLEKNKKPRKFPKV